MVLADYVKPVTSLSFNWITFLTLGNITCSRADLVNISRLTNIGALAIGKAVSIGDTGLDDSIVRAWSRAATENGAFSMLRVLVCRSQKEITPRSFAYFNQFPALALFAVDHCNIGPRDKEQALSLGWKYRTGKDLSGFLMDGGLTDHKWDSTMHASFRCGGVFCLEDLTAEGVEAIDSLPVLHLSLGGAPPDAALDIQTDERMRCFQRVSRQVTVPVIQNTVVKRPMSEAVQMSGQPRKKPTVRASKQQNFDDLLSGFGT
ncbi:hypothetical protein MMC08_002924 [Hypocenomyce scalaris]|nr:hypothetical protein [Hypocenomyce scalaris]